LQTCARSVLHNCPREQMVRRLILAAAIVAAAGTHALAASHPADAKLDAELRDRAHAPRGRSRVILRLAPGVSADAVVERLRGTLGRRLALVGGQVAEVPDTALEALAALPGVAGISLDRGVQGTLERTGATIGATWVRESLGYDGSGVGIAVIDSGVTSWHDDLGSTRVARFVDFVNFQSGAYDDYGHGTHVAGILAGSGFDSDGRRRGIAPGASLLVEKVLDANGQGYISNVIAAIDYAVANKDALRIRIINLSVSAGVYESYTTDPLTLAAKRAVEAGIVVVTAAGNLGRNPAGRTQYGGIGAPGNAPWVITVGASSHMGTVDRRDDIVAGFSSRGPGAIDFSAKPDLVAPGVGTESLADAASTLYLTKPSARLWGTIPTASEPYLALSGTSMASPVVSGTIALMLQANPDLTPNLVKAILQYTAENKHFRPLAQGAGFLNARGAVELSRSFAVGRSLSRSRQGDPSEWNGAIVWGNHRLSHGQLLPAASAWRTDVVWGSPRTADGRNVAWGAECSPSKCDTYVWGVAAQLPFNGATALDGESITWGTRFDGRKIVWGSANDTDNIVWGSDCGGADCANVVWGTSVDADNIVWGTATGRDNIVWGSSLATETRNIDWGTNDLADLDNLVWGTTTRRRNHVAAPTQRR
jgi:serine protease AprX